MSSLQSDAGKASVTLPPFVDRDRVIDVHQVALMLNFSAAHVQRLHRTGKIPRPFKIGGIKNGWRVGTIVDFITAASQMEAA
ncbi:helix-turn-helix transcriptional regulator [Lichenibacterium ramalinae]|uniref:helix-turn-helix transcriptional regulator n=1 Tax=Lichenibacterium ramalinae TaxID=2316527 RepID=UPI00100F96AC|nr:hypothetical protein [Lichenibacterium ramalinae]